MCVQCVRSVCVCVCVQCVRSVAGKYAGQLVCKPRSITGDRAMMQLDSDCQPYYSLVGGRATGDGELDTAVRWGDCKPHSLVCETGQLQATLIHLQGDY